MWIILLYILCNSIYVLLYIDISMFIIYGMVLYVVIIWIHYFVMLDILLLWMELIIIMRMNYTYNGWLYVSMNWLSNSLNDMWIDEYSRWFESLLFGMVEISITLSVYAIYMHVLLRSSINMIWCYHSTCWILVIWDGRIRLKSSVLLLCMNCITAHHIMSFIAWLVMHGLESSPIHIPEGI